ncbi:hypothetical protein [Micromonospora sp. 067-2]|uniref:hypothetical protein n=1 Tax=Micromonospora sp. 067-2 TaxID=2789270 RepID=UPI00397E2FFF
MPDPDYDELVLRALEFYQHAVRRVADDFALRGAVIRPLGVDLEHGDTLMVTYDLREQAGDGALSLPPTGDLEQAVVEMADALQEEEFDEGDTTWPGCTAGHTHPPTAAVVNGVACWQCPRNHNILSRIN